MGLIRRAVWCASIALGALALSAAPAAAHAFLVTSSPAKGGRVKVGPPTVVLTFSESVQVLNRTDVTVVDGDGVRIDDGAARTEPGNPRRLEIPVRGPMVPDSYTVRYRVVSGDSHAAFDAFVFAVGNAPLRPPILAGAGGLADESPVAVAVRSVEVGVLIFLLGLLAFRALVWGPAVDAAAGLSGTERDVALRAGRGVFWRAFWTLAGIAGIAEAAVLAAKSAVVFHTGFVGAALHPADAYRLAAASRFGDVLGWRCAALALLVAVAFVAWSAEADRPPSAGRRGPAALMAALAATALTLLAAQGHASQAPLAPLSIAFDAIHLAAVSLWIGGLVCLVAVLARAPRVLGNGGRAVASAVLVRFSRVALYSVVVIAVSGLARAAGELASPVQLFTTGYGRNLVLKSLLLAPILVLARRNRRLVARLAGGLTPSVPRLHAAARAVQGELAIAAGIVVVAAVLVAQLPGRG